jgi:molybdopterin-guanine dinucleotide biosynthesis protein A
MRAKVTGLILAGGRSSRFGADKAVAVLGRRSLLERAVELLGRWTGGIGISAPAQSASEIEVRRLGYRILYDRPGLSRSPLAGIVAGLEWSQESAGEWMISLPCDVVALPADTFPRLLAAAANANGAYAVTTEGPQSLCAVWPVESRRVLEAMLMKPAHPPVHDILDEMGAAPVYFEGSNIFLNINTRDDLRAAEKALGAEVNETARNG